MIPFAGTYRPLWLGLGAVAFDLLLAVTITSLVRAGVWATARGAASTGWPTRAWPVAVLHGFGTG